VGEHTPHSYFLMGGPYQGDRPFFLKVNLVVTDISTRGLNNMGKRKMYNTTLDVDLLREIKILAAQLDLRQNDLIEEAIQDLIKKYKLQEPSMGVSDD